MKAFNLPLVGLEELASGVWICPRSARGAEFVGSIRSNKYHLPGCHHTDRIQPQNRICFLDKKAVTDYGYTSCATCIK